MTELEQVIKGLEHCVRNDCDDSCPYRDKDWIRRGLATCRAFADDDSVEVPKPMLKDVLALLKEREPRVMTLDEVCGSDCVWYDQKVMGVRPAKVIRVPHKTGAYRVIRFGDIDAWEHADEYGEYWRCWTSRPTDEQREATPWA